MQSHDWAVPAAVISHMPVGVVVVGAIDGSILHYNQRAEAILGNCEACREPVARSLAGESIEGLEWDHLRCDGTRLRLSMNAAPVKNPQGETIATVVVFQDISERKARESNREMLTLDLKRQLRGLQAEKAQAETANAAKSRFLAHMSHEIRTPLAAIMGFCELLQSAQLEYDEAHQYIERIIRNSRNLGGLIDDILDLSKVEAGKLEIETIDVDLVSLIEEVKDLLVQEARKKGISLAVEMEPGTPERILTDPVRLRQILINLVGNAIKFTERGRVVLRAAHAGETADGRVSLEFYVVDTGTGISPLQRERLFQPFSQADPSTSRRFGGTGLGLALSRRLAQLLGGDLRLEESAVGQGSVFVATIVAQALQGHRPEYDKEILQVASKEILQGVSVLVVEDATDNQLMAQLLLTMHGAAVDLAGHGREAIDKALAQDYDIVLMDIQMPLLDGYAATSELRRRGYAKPIVALTAHAMNEERERCFLSGFTDHIPKPLNAALLIQKIVQYTCAS